MFFRATFTFVSMLIFSFVYISCICCYDYVIVKYYLNYLEMSLKREKIVFVKIKLIEIVDKVIKLLLN